MTCPCVSLSIVNPQLSIPRDEEDYNVGKGGAGGCVRCSVRSPQDLVKVGYCRRYRPAIGSRPHFRRYVPRALGGCAFHPMMLHCSMLWGVLFPDKQASRFRRCLA